MVMFAEGDFNAEEYNRVMDAIWGPPPEDEVMLVEGVDDDAITLVEKPKEKKK
jgi:hypothetical protein